LDSLRLEVATEDTTPLGGSQVPPLTILGVSPGAGEDDVPADARVAVTFSNPLDPASLTEETLRLVRDGTTVPLVGMLSYDTDSRLATLTPAAPLEAGAPFVVTVAGGPQGVRDVYGGTLDADTVWGFRVEQRRRLGWIAALILLLLAATAGAVAWGLIARDDEGVDATPATVDFGDQEIGQRSAVQMVTVANNGSSEVVITSVGIEGTNPQQFSTADSSTCGPGPLDGGASCTVGVRFTPTGRGERSATLVVELQEGDPVTAALSGTGVGEAVVSLGANRIDFGRVLVDGGPATRQVELTNAGTAPLRIAEIRIEGDAQADFVISRGATTCSPDQSVPGSGSCTIAVAFSPTEAGERTASLVVEHDGQGGASTVGLRGEGRGEPEGSLEPASVDFGSIEVGTSSDPETVTLTSTGTGDVQIEEIVLEGADPGEFAILDEGSCSAGAPVPSGEECTVVVVFSPTSQGAKEATLAVRAGPLTSTVGLRGEGQGEPEGSLEPASVDFGSTEVGTSSDPETVTLTSTGTGDIQIGEIVLEGADPGEFAILDEGSCRAGAPVPPGEECTVVIVFSPASEGAKEATLAVSDGPLSFESDVAGTGLAVAT
jgi:Bacterial Ig-like domain/HYDIN/CFA65/VesB-like, Ig-like domain